MLNLFTENSTLRNQVVAILSDLGHENGDYLAWFLWGAPAVPFCKIFIYWLAYYALFLVPLLFFLSPAVAIYGFFILALTNTFLHTRVQRKIQTELNTITYLGLYVAIGDKAWGFANAGTGTLSKYAPDHRCKNEITATQTLPDRTFRS